jgi:hypothetical protein
MFLSVVESLTEVFGQLSDPLNVLNKLVKLFLKAFLSSHGPDFFPI